MIVAAVVLPMIPKPARAPGVDVSSQPTCMNNLGHVARAIMAYTQDFDDTYPTVTGQTFEPHGFGPTGGPGYWGPLMTYIPDVNTLHCPAATLRGATYAANGSRKMKWDGYDSIWGLKSWWDKLTYSYAAKTKEVRSPANVILAFDIVSPQLCGMGNSLGDVNSGWLGTFFGQFDANGKPVKPLHGDGMNFAFCDGHVDWVSVVGHPGWNAPTGYLHPPKQRNSGECIAGGRRPSIDKSMADWPEKKISFRRNYSP